MPTLVLLLLFIGPADDEAVWKAIDSGDAAALKSYDPADLIAILRKGRPAKDGKVGEYRETITDAFGRETDVVFIAPENPTGVLIVLHGLGGNADQLKYAYKEFVAQEKLIVIAPQAQPEPEDAQNEDALKGSFAKSIPHWWSYRDGTFVFTALSLAKKRYGFDENRVILSGYSMGGFGSWNIGLRYPDRFAAIVPFAGGISRFEYTKKNDDLLRPLVGNAYHLPCFFVHGDADTTVSVKFDRKTRDKLKELGYEHEYVEVPKGQHMLNVREGSEIMTKVQTWLRPKRRDAHPKKIAHYFVGDYCPQAYWVRVAEFAGPTAEVAASVSGQTIEFTSKGAKKITFYVDEKLLDLSKPIVVKRDGKTLFEGKASPSIETVLESWKAREDRELVFRAKITVDAK